MTIKLVVFGIVLSSVIQGYAAPIFVAPDGDDENDGLSWASAKATIQAGVNSQTNHGETVWLADGTYLLTAEILVNTEGLIIQSLNGPEYTIVDGDGTNRCFSLGDITCTISGLTLTNGYGGPPSRRGGGIFCSSEDQVVTNCVFVGNSAEYAAGMYNGTANDCIFTGNSALLGGAMEWGMANHCTFSGNEGSGMRDGTANHCTFSNNSGATYGGGMSGGTANYCSFSHNTAKYGGGKYAGTANHCTFSDNSAASGGGMYRGTANQCTFSNNSAEKGGGMFSGTANNCLFNFNSAALAGALDPDSFASPALESRGGGMYNSTANNCTFSGNSASLGGGMYGGTANNCIVWYNSGGDLHTTTARHTCSPDVIDGTSGCITNNPLLASSSHLSSGSPCIGAGNASYSTGTDLDGELWANPPSMGCDNFSSELSGLIQLGFHSPFTQCPVGVELPIQLQINGPTASSTLSFGDGQSVSNVLETTHQWKATGEYDLVLSAYTPENPEGLSITQQITVVSSTADAPVFVAPNGNDDFDGRSWASAKATIPAGVNAQTCYGGTVWLADGTYVLSSEILVTTDELTIQSLNGPEHTIIDGGGSNRCFKLYSTCEINGVTLTNGYSNGHGGSIFCSSTNTIVENCVFVENSSLDYGGGMFSGTANYCTFNNNHAPAVGGGIYAGVANHCIFIDNSAYRGGGIYYCTANNCTFSGNSAVNGGGISDSTANNCIVWYNQATNSDNDIRRTTARHTCSPDVTHGAEGCITNAPLFVDQAAGNFRLSATSPCIDAGDNTYTTGAFDLDSNPRIINGTVDLGAYEYAGFIIDSDNDTVSDYEEYIADTSSADPNDWFHISAVSNNTVHFQSSAEREYTLYCTTNLVEGTWVPVETRSGIDGKDSMSGTHNATREYYKLEVRLP